MKREYNIAVVGATGLVGGEMVSILEERSFPVGRLVPVASERSAGETLTFKGRDYPVLALEPKVFEGVDIALFSPGAAVSLEFAPIAARSGAVVIDNTSAFRMDPDIPLVVPEVNPEDIVDYKKKGIIANPNCSTIQLVAVLKPLHDRVCIRRVVVSTYQSVGGAGREAVEELSNQVQAIFNHKDFTPKVFPHQIAFNCIPHIDQFDEEGYTREERKVMEETKKILHAPDLKVVATAVRVPVFFAHSEAVTIEFEKSLDLDEAKALLSKAPGVRLVDDVRESRYPLALHAAGKDEVLVGRLRRDPSVENGIVCWIVADNVRKGAALNAVQIAEILVDNYLK